MILYSSRRRAKDGEVGGGSSGMNMGGGRGVVFERVSEGEGKEGWKKKVCVEVELGP